MENYILPYALFITICFFFAIIALVFAFKCGADCEEELEKAIERIEELDKELKYEIELKKMYESAYDELKAK